MEDTKQVKTVIDAVNFLHGDLDRGFMGCEKDCAHVIHADCGSFFAVNGDYHDKKKLICTIDHFNRIANEMSEHTGEYEFHEYQMSDKTPLEVDVIQEVITNTQEIENAMYGEDLPVETPLEIALRQQRDDIEQCLRKAGYFPPDGLGKVLQDAGKLIEIELDDLYAY